MALPSKLLILFLGLLGVPAFGDQYILVKGAVYYDSEVTLREVEAYTILKDDKAIKDLEKIGHIAEPTQKDQNVLVFYNRGDYVEFIFIDEPRPTTYWAYSRFVKTVQSSPTPTPASALPSATPASPTPSPRPTPVASTPKRPRHKHPSPAVPRAEPVKEWHTLPDGTRKWYYKRGGP